MTLVIDDEFATLIPPLTAEESMQLEANILNEGCKDSLTAWNGVLIDGHNRLRICEKHSLPYSIVDMDFSCKDEAKQYIILNQFGRRNLSVGDRCLLALKLESIFQSKAKMNQKQSHGRGQKGSQVLGNLFPSVDSAKEVAKIAGVSHTTIERAKHIQTHGTLEHIARIKQGGTGNTVNAVYKELREASKSNIEKIDQPKTLAAVAAPILAAPGPEGGQPEERLTPVQGELDTSGEETSDAGTQPVSDIDQIKQYVAELKNPNIDRSFTVDMLLMEYDAFAERFIRSMSTFQGEAYTGLYPLLSTDDWEQLSACNSDMIHAIGQIDKLINEKRNIHEKTHSQPVHR